MTESSRISTSLALHYLEQAETYKKLGLRAQVRHELERARGLDPYIAQEDRYRALLDEAAYQPQVDSGLKVPLRIGAGMLFVNALLGAIFVIILLTAGGTTELSGGDFMAPIVDVIIGVNLWLVKESWKRYTVWWALIGLVIFGVGALVTGDYITLIIQLSFSGSLILLLAGRPSKVRTIVAASIFVVAYLGLVCLVFTLSFLGVMGGTGG
ncbi:MAG TPA: hypothetical protein VF918_08000 [Anaerolineales bacterium]